ESEAGDVVLRILWGDGLQDSDGHQVLGPGERRAHSDRAIESAIEVSGLPVHRTRLAGIYGQRCVVDNRRRRKALLERRGVDERLEARTGLAARLGDVVVLVAVIVKPSDHGADRAVIGAYGHQ